MELPGLPQEDLRLHALEALKVAPDSAAPSSIDDLGHELAIRLENETGTLGFSGSDYWLNTKREIKVLVCTEEPRYKDLREKLKSGKDKVETITILTIASALAPHVGLVAGALTGLCALCLLALANVGKEAFCRSVKLNVPFGD